MAVAVLFQARWQAPPGGANCFFVRDFSYLKGSHFSLQPSSSILHQHPSRPLSLAIPIRTLLSTLPSVVANCVN
jgi:hypothetical protein